MGIFILAKGFSLGLAIIMPIGGQNSMLLTQGINRNHHLTTATLFILYDVFLIALGLLGGSIIMTSSSLLFNLLSWGGILFLVSYGFLSAKAALFSSHQLDTQVKQQKSLKYIFIASLMVTFLNPHVYIDTVILIGSVGGQYQGNNKLYFMLGTMLASVVWFLFLALAAAKLSTQLSKTKIKRTIDFAIAIIMWLIAWSLFEAWFSRAI